MFGRSYEDASIELTAFAERRRVFCIAAAGSTARALAVAGHEVTAVDINAAQVEYAKARARGGEVREGAAERLLARGRYLLRALGWSESRRQAFLSLEDPAAQAEYWQQTLETSRWRCAIDTLFSPWVLRVIYANPFVAALPPNFGPIMRARLRRCWAVHPNRTNPFAWSLLLGDKRGDPDPPVTIRVECADAADYLETCKAGSFDAFSLSNIVDGADASYVIRLREAVRHAASRGAMLVSRSFAEPAAASVRNWAERDRSPLWGVVEVGSVEGF
jgi:S-adenosylmethionine:diacylglycerol 3-amino-3-carboxypropyl transferase